MTVRTVFIATLACVALAAGAAHAEESAGSVPEPRITFHKSPAGVRGVKLLLYLKTEPRRVWEVVTTPSKAAALFKNVSAIRPSSKRGAGFRDYHLSSAIGEKVVTCKIRQDDAKMHVSWKRVEGDLVELYGYYKIRQAAEHPGHSRVDYGSYIDPGGVGRVMMTNRGRARMVKFMIGQLRRMSE